MTAPQFKRRGSTKRARPDHLLHFNKHEWTSEGMLNDSLRIQTLGRASQGVNWSWSQCIKSHHAQTSSGKGLPNHFWNRNNVRSILSGDKKIWTVAQWSSFQIKLHFAFYLEIRVRSFWSQGWFGVPWYLLVLVHCVLSRPKSMQPSTRRFYSTLCFYLLTSLMEMLLSFPAGL